MDGSWLSILEYAHSKNKSISSVRRYIKAGRVKYKEENGKYFIWDKKYLNNKAQNLEEKEILRLKFENERLTQENFKLKESLAELNMLVDVLERETKKYQVRNELPNLPKFVEK